TVRRSVTVDLVEPGSAGAAAGLKAGDVIEQGGGVPTATSIDVERGFLDQPAGAKVPVTVRRDGRAVTAAVVLQPAERGEAGPAADMVWRRTGLRMTPVGKEAV